MFQSTKAFSSFSVDDLQKAKDFYRKKLGLEIAELKEGLELHLTGGVQLKLIGADRRAL